MGATYAIADDRVSAIWSDFGGGAVPRNTIIDMNGVVRYNSIGFNESTITGILDQLLSTAGSEVETEFPENHGLIIAYPNPFNGQTSIRIEVPAPGYVILIIMDINGRQVRQVLAEELSTDAYTVVWNARDDTGDDLPSGVYIASLSYVGGQDTRKILLLK